VFSKGVLPEVHTVFNATAKLNHSSIKAKAKEAYDNKVKEFTGAGTLYRDEEELKAILDEAKKASMAVYQDTPKLAAEASSARVHPPLFAERRPHEPTQTGRDLALCHLPPGSCGGTPSAPKTLPTHPSLKAGPPCLLAGAQHVSRTLVVATTLVHPHAGRRKGDDR